MQRLLHTHLFIMLITLAVFLGSVVALLLFASSMKEREARVIEARDRLASFEQNKRIFAEEAKELEAIKQKVASLEAKILTEETLPEFLSSLEAMAKAQGVDFTIVGLSQEGPKGAVPQPRVDISARGSFSAIESLVEAMLSQEYQLRFSRFSLYQSESGEGSKAGAWQLLAAVHIISFQ